MEKRIQLRKKRQVRNRIIKLVVLVLLAIFLIIFTLIKVGLFKVNSIEVSGNKNTKTEDIIKQSKISKGSNLYFFQIKDSEESLKELPFIKSSKITNSIRGKIKIVVSEREKIAQIQDGNYFYPVDDEFRILEKTLQKDTTPVIKGVKAKTYNIGDFIYQNEERQKLDFLKQLFNVKFEIIPRISEITLNSGTATLLTTNGIKIEFGSFSNVEYKLKLLKPILVDIEETGKDADTIYMEKGNDPILTLKSENVVE